MLARVRTLIPPAATLLAAGSAIATVAVAGPAAAKGTADDDDMDDIEAILRKHGIQ